MVAKKDLSEVEYTLWLEKQYAARWVLLTLYKSDMKRGACQLVH